MSFLKYRGDSPLNRPLTFSTPSKVGDAPEKRAKVKRDLMAILDAAERYLGPQELDQVVRDHRNARKGNTADEPLNKLLLAEFDAARAKGRVDIPEFSRCFYERRGQRQSAKAVEKRLRRLLRVREKKAELDRKLRAALHGPSLIGTK